MAVEVGFDVLQAAVDVPKDDLDEARRRRRVFVDAFKTASDVSEAWGSGSLARSTHKDPIHDVDMVVVFDAAEHPGWGEPGDSAEEALEYTRELAKSLLSESDGDESLEIRLTRLQNHAVKCFLDDPDSDSAFTVDVTPALTRVQGGICIPEKNSEKWVATHPKLLIARVAERQADWDEFRRLVRVLKRWNTDHGGTMKSLVVEVLALEHLRRESRPLAIQRFFTAAAEAVLDPVEDPAGLCGEIEPGMDRYEAKNRLDHAAALSWQAVNAAADGEADRAMCLWREAFGDIYPEPEGGCADCSGAAAGAAVPVVNVAPPRRPVRDAPQG